jgi:hypothetical protein
LSIADRTGGLGNQRDAEVGLADGGQTGDAVELAGDLRLDPPRLERNSLMALAGRGHPG